MRETLDWLIMLVSSAAAIFLLGACIVAALFFLLEWSLETERRDEWKSRK